MYDKYVTRRRGQGAHIASIIEEKVQIDCYLILGKVMQKYTKGECTLDAIQVEEFNKNGAPMNWCKYLLT